MLIKVSMRNSVLLQRPSGVALAAPRAKRSTSIARDAGHQDPSTVVDPGM
jgi:hypothetical protein